MTLLQDSSTWKSGRQDLKAKQHCKKWAGFIHPTIYGDTAKRMSCENGHATPIIHIFWVQMGKFCYSFTEVMRTNTCSSDYFFSGGQINKDSALLPWDKSSVAPSTFLIHGWTELICYTVFLISGLLRQATRTNGCIWISHRQAVRLKQQPLRCPSSAPVIPQGFA